MKYDFVSILNRFEIEGTPISAVRYGEGHINETYLAETDLGSGRRKKYILQRINDGLFKEVDKLMNNIRLVTEFNRERILARGGNPDRESLSLVYKKDGASYDYDAASGGYFRVYKFIENAVAYQVVEKPEHFYQSAVAFGDFANLLSQFDASKLYEVLPDFHNTVKRFNDFEASLKKDACGRAASVAKEIDFVLSRKRYCPMIVSLLKSGEMPSKVTHNDTKLNNVMLDAATGKYVAVIDLDTVMPGSICYDFGDSIRFGCNTAAEDERDLDKVNFDINLFKTYSEGYLTSLGGATEAEKENLALGAIIMTYECGMRFLADFLDGDVYFRVKRDGHNLDRARTQFKLVSDMEKRYSEMQKITTRYGS